jgi:hypothetical protein
VVYEHDFAEDFFVFGSPVGEGFSRRWHHHSHRCTQITNHLRILDYRCKDREEMARRYESLIGDEPKRRRRGPERALSVEALTTVVKPAYEKGGRKPVVAVRDALSKQRGEPVTMDQARKAVVRAREIGVLPPAGGRGKP